VLDLAGGIQRIDIDALALGVRTLPARTIEVVIVEVASPVAFPRRGGSRTATASLARPAASSRRPISAARSG
jgi:hypothetical protein